MDLTAGRPIKQILLFALPLVLGSLFQQLYSFVDTVMVGRLISSNALAAVGASHSLHFLIIGFAQGTCAGFSVPLAKAIGAQKPEDFKRYFWGGCWICIVMAVVLTAVTVTLTEPLLGFLNTPADIFADAKSYVQVMFLGIPATILYNFCAGVLRATGDSRRPFYFLLFSSFLNIVLDYVFIVPIPLGVAGAALATVLSQLTSGLLNVYWFARKNNHLKNGTGLRRPSAACIKSLCRVGFPMGLDSSIAGLGSVFMQGSLNTLGTIAVTGQTAGEKIRHIFTVPLISVGTAMATYVGQNDGAGRPDRIKDGIKSALLIQLVYCAASWLVIFFAKDAFTALVLGPDTGQAAGLAVQYLSIISTLFIIQGSLMVMRNALQGLGYSSHVVLSGVGELAGRGLGGWLAAKYLGFVGICFANPLAWFFALVYCTYMVVHFLKKRDQGK